jgi:cytoskeletal protein CcmA (bactofilin family)
MPRSDLRRTYISAGSLFSGRFINHEIVTIDGRFEGHRVEAREVFIGKSGRVKADIRAEHIIVEGVVIGDIESSSRVILMPTARVLGRVTTNELIIQRGVVFEGTCVIRNDVTDKSSADHILALYEKGD